ncbi:hypothetical protein Rsub_04127 [Raphidocelis subcapitata]|uniref:LSM domain-containing protein n=1 Tax=Raphidocelis subcapitata TaxID=307507 RepID=A0A2V0P2G1_9CHLO|nr:hypothetical protein Rsub_04127 [Raphidocelis subcapitata]|eukprot:GBF91387.1 hypothetical protein Rsub_04127 [Raphidocelis subcapitata]
MAAAGAGDKPAVEKVQQLLHRRFKVVLPDDRVIVGDFQCLDKQGNLILAHAHEVIAHAAAAPAAPSSSGGGGGGKPEPNGGRAAAAAAGAGPMEKPLGMVLVPRAQQKDVRLMVTLSERAAMLQLAGS